ncbi:MAG: hypothetical protein R3F62_24730 [Planctomycetota bacterium]
MRSLVPALLVAATFAPAASAVELRLAEPPPEVVFLGEPVSIAVDLVDLDVPLEQLELTADPGLRVEGPRSLGRRVEVLNGARSDALRVGWSLHPRAPGTYALGPLTLVTEDGERRELSFEPVVVRAPSTGDGLSLEVEAEAGGPVGVPFRVTYTLLSPRPFARSERRSLFDDGLFERAFGHDPFAGLDVPDLFGGGRPALRGLGLRFLDDPDLDVVGVPADPAREAQVLELQDGTRLHLQQGRALEDGAAYYALRFAFELTPRAEGTIDLGARATVAVERPARSRFDRGGAEERTAEAPDVRYRVEPLPTAGRPPGFSGAIGRYTIEASCPTRRVNAHDPLTVTLSVRGSGLLEPLQAPAWHEVPALTRDFDVVQRGDPGRVVGDAKLFTLTLRPRSEAVHEVPAIPFPSYDPASGAYVVAESAPLPLEVLPVEAVTAADAVGVAAPAAEPEPEPAAPAGRAFAADLRAPRWDGTLTAVALAPPLLALGWPLALVAWRRGRARSAVRRRWRDALDGPRQRAGRRPGGAAGRSRGAPRARARARARDVDEALCTRDVPVELRARVRDSSTPSTPPPSAAALEGLPSCSRSWTHGCSHLPASGRGPDADRLRRRLGFAERPRGARPAQRSSLSRPRRRGRRSPRPGRRGAVARARPGPRPRRALARGAEPGAGELRQPPRGVPPGLALGLDPARRCLGSSSPAPAGRGRAGREPGPRRLVAVDGDPTRPRGAPEFGHPPPRRR